MTCSTTERHPHLSFYFDARLPRLTLNLWSPWLRLPRGCNYKPAPLGLAIRHHFNFPFTLQLVYLHLGDIFLCGGHWIGENILMSKNEEQCIRKVLTFWERHRELLQISWQTFSGGSPFQLHDKMWTWHSYFLQKLLSVVKNLQPEGMWARDRVCILFPLALCMTLQCSFNLKAVAATSVSGRMAPMTSGFSWEVLRSCIGRVLTICWSEEIILVARFLSFICTGKPSWWV